MRKVMFALAIWAGAIGPASAATQVAPGVWQMQNYGRNHGMITDPACPSVILGCRTSAADYTPRC